MNTVDFGYFKTMIYDWVTDKISSTVTEVIWADQNAPAPDDLYVTLKIMSRNVVGRDYVGRSSAAGDAPIRGNREIFLSIQGFMAGAFQAISDLEEAFRFSEIDQSLHDAAIAFIDTEGIKDITELVGTKLEERASLDVRLRIGAPFEEIIADIAAGAIENVEGSGTVDGQQVTIDVDT